MKKGSGMRQLLAVLLAVWMAAAGALGAAAQEEKKAGGNELYGAFGTFDGAADR